MLFLCENFPKHVLRPPTVALNLHFVFAHHSNFPKLFPVFLVPLPPFPSILQLGAPAVQIPVVQE